MTIHSKMKHKIEELEAEIGRLSSYIEDGRSIITEYLDDDMQADNTDLSEWAESGPAVSVSRIQRDAIVELSNHMDEAIAGRGAEIIRQWAAMKMGIEGSLLMEDYE